jgi:hypothetical protein
MDGQDKILYSLCVRDFQDVAEEVIGRRLTHEELMLVQDTVGDYIDWRDAIEYAIHKLMLSKRASRKEATET